MTKKELESELCKLKQEKKELMDLLNKALAAIPNVNLPNPGIEYAPVLPWHDSGIRYC